MSNSADISRRVALGIAAATAATATATGAFGAKKRGTPASYGVLQPRRIRLKAVIGTAITGRSSISLQHILKSLLATHVIVFIVGAKTSNLFGPVA